MDVIWRRLCVSVILGRVFFLVGRRVRRGSIAANVW